jgi:hypothetical protein
MEERWAESMANSLAGLRGPRVAERTAVSKAACSAVLLDNNSAGHSAGQ